MTVLRRATPTIGLLAALALGLTGCASSGGNSSVVRNVSTVENLTPIQNTPVATANLPAIGPDGTIQQDQVPQQDFSQLPSQPAQIGAPMQTANADGSFVTLDSVGAVPNAPGRNLSGGLTIEKLLGGWTVVSGAQQCKLNLTYTAKTGTNRYRASTPGCALAGLKVVASWQLLGNQVQLFDENNDIIASLILAGNRFIGTLAGGQGISMVG